MGLPSGNSPSYNMYQHFPDQPEIKEKKFTGGVLDKSFWAFLFHEPAYLFFLALSNHFTKSEIQTKEGEEKYVFQKKNIFLVQKYFNIAL